MFNLWKALQKKAYVAVIWLFIMLKCEIFQIPSILSGLSLQGYLWAMLSRSIIFCHQLCTLLSSVFSILKAVLVDYSPFFLYFIVLTEQILCFISILSLADISPFQGWLLHSTQCFCLLLAGRINLFVYWSHYWWQDWLGDLFIWGRGGVNVQSFRISKHLPYGSDKDSSDGEELGWSNLPYWHELLCSFGMK